MQTVGRHLLIDLRGCDPALLDDPAVVRRALRIGVRASRSTLIGLRVHAFPGMGVTGLALLAESHLAIHTWPEHDYAAADVFTCGSQSLPENVIPVLVSHFRATEVHTVSHRRIAWLDPSPADEIPVPVGAP